MPKHEADDDGHDSFNRISIFTDDMKIIILRCAKRYRHIENTYYNAWC